MRSVFLVLSACVAISHASSTCDSNTDVDADGSSLLQARSLVRKQGTQMTDAQTMLKSMKNVANSFTKGSVVTMTPEDVNAAIGTANTALQTMFPMLAEQHALAQREIELAVAAVQACHDEHGGEVRSRLAQVVARDLDAKEQCEESLADAIAAEHEACEGQGEDPNCLCNEARALVPEQRALCAAVIETYEAVYCEQQASCTSFHECHAREMEIYTEARANIEAAMISRQGLYRTYMQTDCLMRLTMAAMLSSTPIDDARLLACSDGISIDQLTINFPEQPPAPAECPEPQNGDPQCGGHLCSVEVETSSRTHAATSTGASVQLLVDGVWSSGSNFANNIALDEVVTSSQWVSARPTSVRLTAGGSNAWGYRRIAVTCDGHEAVVLDSVNGEVYSGSEANRQFWLDGNQAAPASQEYQIPTQVQSEWNLVIKSNGDATLGFSSTYWTDSLLLNEQSPVAEAGNAKYAAFNDAAVTQIRLCINDPESNCFEHTLPSGHTSARSLFSSGYVADDAFDKDELVGVLGGTLEHDCAMEKPGFNTECPQSNKARFGFCNNVPDQSCQADPLNPRDSDAALGIGLSGQSSREVGAGWTHYGINRQTGATGRNMWLWVKE